MSDDNPMTDREPTAEELREAWIEWAKLPTVVDPRLSVILPDTRWEVLWYPTNRNGLDIRFFSFSTYLVRWLREQVAGKEGE